MHLMKQSFRDVKLFSFPPQPLYENAWHFLVLGLNANLLSAPWHVPRSTGPKHGSVGFDSAKSQQEPEDIKALN